MAIKQIPLYLHRLGDSECVRLISVRIIVDAGYKNTGYKNMPVIRTLTRFTESFVYYSIEFLSDIRTFHAGYKNMPDIRTFYWKTVGIYPYIIYAGYKNMFL